MKSVIRGIDGDSVLQGKKLVRIAYMDESGVASRHHEKHLVVTAAIVYGDTQWKPISEEIQRLTNKYIPKDEREGFAFHAKDLYWGGKKYFNKKTWGEKKRFGILDELVALPGKFHVPIAFGAVEKVGRPEYENQPEKQLMHEYSVAFSVCVGFVERWMRSNAPSELAKLEAEDRDKVKQLTKESIKLMKNPDWIKKQKKPQLDNFLPMRHIIDDVAFVSKTSTPMMVLADVSAFAIRRQLANADNCHRFFAPLLKQLVSAPNKGFGPPFAV